MLDGRADGDVTARSYGPAVADPAELFEAIAAEYVHRPGVRFGRMMASPGLRIDGRIFAMLTRDALVVKVPAARAAELVESGAATAFEPRPGRRMREWVVLSAVGAAPDSAGWRAATAEAFDYVSSLAG